MSTEINKPLRMKRSKEDIFVRSDFLDVLLKMGLMSWESVGFSATYRSRKHFEPIYIKMELLEIFTKLGLCGKYK